jgi:hypothetical protein
MQATLKAKAPDAGGFYSIIAAATVIGMDWALPA